MDPALVSLAAAAGTALVQAMTKDTWEAVKARFSMIFSRHGEVDQAELARELDETAQRLRSSSGPLEPAVDEERRRWATLLAAFLSQHGEAAPELHEFVRDVRQLTARDSFNVVQHITAGRDSYTAGRDQHVVFPEVDDDDEG
ncbi:hypothetical protein AB0B89_06425 [Sphaerisporangium sp. NPDC049002]|uniref:hypothetical protein n=1 Tax=unclassified Sphaerisporangium TaxID=2630420 RepID=UPI0033CA53F7